ncbi:MAG: AraC family transcriptional regulator [Eubacteriales bacterium]|nr:AraC family transcriptional regulator [Eubacteriales bacterium]
MEPFEIEKRFQLFYELLKPAYDLSYWIYDLSGNVIETNNQNRPLEAIFRGSGAMSIIQEYCLNNRLPILLTAPFGPLWCAAFEYKESELFRIHVLGPAFHTNVSLQALRKMASQHDIPLSWRSNFLNLLSTLPTISINAMNKLAVMLHKSLTGEDISVTDVTAQTFKTEEQPVNDVVEKDRSQTYMVEQAILSAIREGNPDYAKALARAQSISDGVPVQSDNPLDQSKISIIVFISLCVRAAIEGGLTPDKAYSIGDSYIQQVNSCENFSHMANLSSEMYNEFIRLVHEKNKRPDISQTIQSCCDYIQMHVEGDLSLDTIAERGGYTGYYLSRKFKSEMGISINDYINRQRIERAKLLLISTSDDLQEISDRLHFGTRSYFTLTFKKLTGISPSDYRKQNQK